MMRIFSVKLVPVMAWSSSTPYNLRPKLPTFFYLNLGLVLFGVGTLLFAFGYRLLQQISIKQ